MSRDIQMPIPLDDIDVPDGRREVVAASVKRLADSIEQVGLRHPITVRRKGDRYILVAGRHRMEACRKLGREHVPATIVTMTNDEARLWEIAENLHRADLTKLERDEQVAEWVRITNKVAQVAPVSGGRGHEGGVRAAARELGIERTDAQRAVATDDIVPEAKQAIREAGLDNNRSAYLQVARLPAEQQVAKVIQLSDHPKDDYERSAEWRRSFEKLWNKAPNPKDHEWAREWIDRPIMSKEWA